MTLSDDDFDVDFCPTCGRVTSDRLDRIAHVSWIVALMLTSVASALVIALAIRALS